VYDEGGVVNGLLFGVYIAGNLCMSEDGIKDCVISPSYDNQIHQNICLMKFLLSYSFLT